MYLSTTTILLHASYTPYLWSFFNRCSQYLKNRAVFCVHSNAEIHSLFSFNLLQTGSRSVILESKDLVTVLMKNILGTCTEDTLLPILPNLLSSSTEVDSQIALNSVIKNIYINYHNIVIQTHLFPALQKSLIPVKITLDLKTESFARLLPTFLEQRTLLAFFMALVYFLDLLFYYGFL